MCSVEEVKYMENQDEMENITDDARCFLSGTLSADLKWTKEGEGGWGDGAEHAHSTEIGTPPPLKENTTRETW